MPAAALVELADEDGRAIDLVEVPYRDLRVRAQSGTPAATSRFSSDPGTGVKA
jgi:hypothetical protein